MSPTFRRFATLAPIGGLFCFALTGCGSSTTPAPATADAAATQPATEESVAPGTDVVSQFLDQVRRGGEDSGVANLLTAQARAELERIGQTVQPIGSPDASFEVTRGEIVPEDPNAMLVHTIWREPAEDGSQTDSQVVWALRKESVGWRISGLAMELESGQEPLVINFEDGDRMKQILGGAEVSPPADEAAAQAALPTENQSR